jgi:hypothetical protein
MAACPNCGRRTLRTKDWVCQWCGYPLLYGGFKPIDKTYKELQEERASSYQSEEPETEPDIEYEPEPEPEPKPEPKWKLKKAPKPTYKPKPQPETEPELKYEPEPEPEPRPVPRPAPQPAPRPLAQPRPQPAPQTRPEPELLPRSQPEPVLLPKPEPAPPPTLRTTTPPRMEPPPRVPPPPVEEPKPEPVVVPSLESIKDGTQLTIDQIDALFRTDNVGANEALKDKTLVVKGIVNKIFIRDHIDVRYVVLTGARRVVWSARCSFEKESVGPISRLSEGQAVALRGKYDGYSKNIIFKECELVASN